MYCSDCIDYAPGGKCRNPKVSKSLVGYFQAPCREFIEKPKTTTTMETKPTTKVCKVCGQEKPLEEFQRSPWGKDGRIATCKECRGRLLAQGKAERKAAAVPAVPPVPSDPSPKWNGPKDPDGLIPEEDIPAYKKAIRISGDADAIAYLMPLIPDAGLAAELRRRGYTGTLTKSNTLNV